jgi:4-amino-4-deoxy-L-arabinose transferase-like glycosyltransferase
MIDVKQRVGYSPFAKMTDLNSYRIVLLCLALSLFLVATLSRVDITLAEWDHVILNAAQYWSKGINKAWFFDHPPLYPSFLALLFKIFGSGAEVARVGNIACSLLTGLILFRLTAQLCSRQAAFWATMIYLVSPVCIQGLSSLDMADTSLLPLFFLLTAGALRKLFLRPSFFRALVLGVWFGLCFWAKITSTIALMASFAIGFIFLYWFDLRHRAWSIGKYLAISFGFGVAIYLLTSFIVLSSLWGTAAFFYPLKAAYAALAYRQAHNSASSIVLSFIYSMARIFIWFSPYLLLILVVAVWSSFKVHIRKKTDESRFILLVGIATTVYFLAHMVIGGTNWGFPRYQVAVLPMMCLLAGNYLSESTGISGERYGFWIVCAVVGMIIVNGLWFCDPILFFNMRLKQMLLENMGWQHIVVKALKVFLPLYIIPIAASVWLILRTDPHSRNLALALCLVISFFTTSITLNAHQYTADYRTSVQYGAVGKEEVIRLVRTRLTDGDCVLATPEFIAEFRNYHVPEVNWEELRTQDRFSRFVKLHAPVAIIGGMTVSTLDQLTWLLGTENQTSLSRNYRFHQVGTYYLWLRVDANNNNT